MRRIEMFLLAVMLLPQFSHAQTDVHALEDALKGKQMWLRNYSADSIARYEWSNGSLAGKPVKLHAIGAFTTRSVKYKHDKLILEGERATLIRDAAKNQISRIGRVPMTLEVDLQSADPAQVIPNLQAMMFFPNGSTAVAGQPEFVADILPFDISKPPAPAQSSRRVLENGHWFSTSPTAKVVQPKVLSSVEPSFTDDAREARVHGAVMLVISVSETGHVDDLWLAKPLGYGLDESAADAVRRYVFKPAQYEGKSVGTVIQIQVNFVVP